MHILTVQSKEVLNILQRDGVYRADSKCSREHMDYAEDKMQLGGVTPIWCWAYPCMDFVTLCDNSVLEYLRCEMSLDQENCWDSLYMLEVEVSYNDLRIGKSRNRCSWSRVFKELRAIDVYAVYILRDSEIKGKGWYYKVVTPIWTRENSTVLIPSEMDCYVYSQHLDQPLFPRFQVRQVGYCVACGKVTTYSYWNKHLCNIDCVSKLVNTYIHECAMLNIDAVKYEDIFKYAIDHDFEKGMLTFLNTLKL